MQGFSRIRWTKTDYSRLRSSINEFNRKVRRLKSQGLTYIPDEVKYKDYKKLIKSRRDLDREIRTLDRFSRENASDLVYVESMEGKVPITRWQRNEINRRRGIINRRRQEMASRLKDVEFTYQGEGMGYKVSDIRMGTEIEGAFTPFITFGATISNLDVKKKWNVVLNQSQSDYLAYRTDILRKNIIKEMKKYYDKNDIVDILKNVENMSDDELIMRFYRTGGNFEPIYAKKEYYEYFLNDLRANWL